MVELIKHKSASSLIGKTKGIWKREDWDFIPLGDVWYAGGIETIDTNLNISKPRAIKFEISKHNEGLNFQIFRHQTSVMEAFKMRPGSKSFVLYDSEINKITFGQSELMKEHMGVIGKGLIGGALLGPAGLLLGALKGHSDTTKDNSTLISTIHFNRKESDMVLALEIGPKCKNKFLTFFQHNYKNILINKDDEKVSEKPKVDVASEIEKFHKLKESGIITEEEFEKKKSELLG